MLYFLQFKAQHLSAYAGKLAELRQEILVEYLFVFLKVHCCHCELGMIFFMLAIQNLQGGSFLKMY